MTRRAPRTPQGPADRSTPRPGRRRPAAEGAPHKNRADDEQKLHGRHACHALFAHRAADIIRVYVTAERLKEFSDLLKWCAEQRRAYHIVESENLERIAETVHHQGIVMLAKKLAPWDDAQLARMVQTGTLQGPLLYLDGIQNPHNLGSILRTAAHFGAAAVLGRRGEMPGLTASAARVAEGGAETVPLVPLDDPLAALATLKNSGYRVLASTSHLGGNVYRTEIPPLCVLVLGNEVQGVSAEILAISDESLRIPGTGAVESLNVAVAAAVLLSEAQRGRAEKVSPPAAGVRPLRRSRGKSRRAR